jgi:hypothetical protein
MGIATNSKGHIFIYHRSGDTRLFEFDQAGAFVREIGQGVYGLEFAHAVRVDAQDNVWVVDEGTNMVIKFNPEGTKILMVIGRRPDPILQLTNMPGNGGSTNANKPYEFSRQTDVAFDPQGNIFVSDGYGDNRVVKYDKNGRFIKSSGTQGRGQDQLSLPHTIAADAKGISTSAIARTPCRCGTTTEVQRLPNVGSPGPFAPGRRPSILYASNSWPDSAPAGSGYDRRGLQDGTRRHDHRQVREGR